MITFVSGFQRCGSSLVCQMLHAGGLPVFHDAAMGYPSFETMRQFSADDGRRGWISTMAKTTATRKTRWRYQVVPEGGPRG